MPVDQFESNYANLAPSEFIVLLGNFADLPRTYPFFKDNWPSYLTHPTKLKEQLAVYHELMSATETDGGRKNTKERDDRRNKAHVSAVFMGQYVVMRSVSENDPSFLTTVGLKLKSVTIKNYNENSTLVAPVGVTAKHGKVSRTAVISYSKVTGAGSYEIQCCQGDPNQETSWNSVGQYSRCRAEIKGQEPAQKIYFRVRCQVNGGPGPFSNVVSIIVL